MQGNKKQRMLSILLVLSLFLNVGLLIFTSYKKLPNSIIGTYCTSTEMLKDDKYIVFERDGPYVLYKQLELIEEGNYKPNGTNIYSLLSQEKAAEHSVIYNDSSNTLFFISSDNSIISFDKISSTPTFINLPDEFQTDEYSGN